MLHGNKLVFEGFSQRTIDFIWNLRFNNNKTWFETHKDEFLRDFQYPMKALGQEVFERVTVESGDRGFIHKVSRIYKDARRVRDGEPYRTNLWFSIEVPSEEWTSTPVFWFELAPENWSYGLGYYSARPETMAKLRARIDKNPENFEQRIAILDRQDEFVFDGPEYVRKKEAPTLKTAAWYNKKSFSLVHRQANGEELFSPELVDRLAAGYRFLMPLYDYFVTLDADPVP
ncbi:MAG: DUF2461 domain-containing protein [Gracilibacteraceae bacterium]|jgi:uncharacterized protein (TIGR02453 family)|nr:DUF2461 domain-containing protein [Gracilibacteraceae bacterium]